jgi:hypothetical protein
MDAIIAWARDNWEILAEAGVGLWVAASAIVALTPTKEDDKVLRKIAQYLSPIVGGRFSLPGTRPDPSDD